MNPSANEDAAHVESRLRKACRRVVRAFAGALLVFSGSAIANHGIIGTVQGVIDGFLPIVVALAVGGFVFLVVSWMWKLIRALWATRYSSTARSAFVFGVCLAIAAIVLFEWLLVSLRLSSNVRSVIQCVFVVLTSVVAVESEAAFLALTLDRDDEGRIPLTRVLASSAAFAKKKAHLASLSYTTLPSLYRLVGKRVANLEKVPSKVAEGVATICSLRNALSATEAAGGQWPSDDRSVSVMFTAWECVKNSTRRKQLRIQLDAAYVALGRQAVEKYGESAAPGSCEKSSRQPLDANASCRVTSPHWAWILVSDS